MNLLTTPTLLLIFHLILQFPSCRTYAQGKDGAKKEVVARSIEGGTEFLLRSQMTNGAFDLKKAHDVGITSLAGLALMECGIDKKSPAIARASDFIRTGVLLENDTYDISLAMIFLHRLGEQKDRPLLKTLAVRLLAGQISFGGWGYKCPVLDKSQEVKILLAISALDGNKIPDFSKVQEKKANRPIKDLADNSNTQFALLALGGCSDLEVPLGFTLAAAHERFRSSQKKSGWGYRWGKDKGYGNMTCAGLLGLALGNAWRDLPENEARIKWGLWSIGMHIRDKSQLLPQTANRPGIKPDLYYLWSIERIGKVFDIQTIGGEDWYKVGSWLILNTQLGNGSWLGAGKGGGNPVVDTSFALLFLRKSDLLPDLRVTLKKRLKITDPWLDGKTLDPKSFPTPYRPGEDGSLQDRLPPGLRPRPNDSPRLRGKEKQ